MVEYEAQWRIEKLGYLLSFLFFYPYEDCGMMLIYCEGLARPRKGTISRDFMGDFEQVSIALVQSLSCSISSRPSKNIDLSKCGG